MMNICLAVSKKVYGLGIRGFKLQGSGSRVQGSGGKGSGVRGSRIRGSGCKVQGSGCRVQGQGCKLQGCRAQDSHVSVPPLVSDDEHWLGCFQKG